MDNISLGTLGEDTAARLLEAEGYEIAVRNYRCTAGEVDIIARRGAELHFIEVKTRRDMSRGRPCEAVDARKRHRIRTAALWYLHENSGCAGCRIRFDVIEIVMDIMEGAF